uniref:Disease resistance R13L4/SHOC-2-like LRR domain-containing protein n=1 Tax=Oryza punctata TaxID=4537 RepID=A0A0E0M9H6_ORYPU
MGGSAEYSLNIPNDIGERFSRLHTLDLSNFGLTGLPESIGKLKHLRCLQLRGTKIRWLPKSMCYLYNLQTLGLRDCYDLRGFPSKINDLSKLRHIDLAMTRNPSHSVCRLRCMPQGMGSLTDLQTLSRFVISQRRPHNFYKADITELASLNNLHGQLIISKLHLVKDAEEASQACLASKKFLQKLELSWGDNGRPSKQFLPKLELSWGDNGRQPELDFGEPKSTKQHQRAYVRLCWHGMPYLARFSRLHKSSLCVPL